MGKNRRRNKREVTNIIDVISTKTFITLTSILLVVILVCTATIIYKRNEDEKLLAKQKEELDKQIETIFSETMQSIAEAKQNETQKDTIIKISAVGDILCGDEMIEDAYNTSNNSYNFSQMFTNITKFMEESDISIGTMETNFTNSPYSGYGRCNAPKEFAQAVKNSGINLVNICHNHSLDYGKDGLQQTKAYLESLEFDTVGALTDNSVVIKEVNEVKLAFVSYTYGVNSQDSKSKTDLEAISIFNKEQAQKDITYAKENAEYICVFMHWGDIYSNNINNEQKEITDFLVEQNVDLILGAHPSAVQPMEVRKNAEGKNVFIAYSIGNYISSINEENAKIELILNIEIRKSSEDGQIHLSKVDYTPVYVLDNGANAENRYELIDMKGTAKEYANGNTKIVNKETYEKLLSGLELLNKLLRY